MAIRRKVRAVEEAPPIVSPPYGSRETEFDRSPSVFDNTQWDDRTKKPQSAAFQALMNTLGVGARVAGGWTSQMGGPIGAGIGAAAEGVAQTLENFPRMREAFFEALPELLAEPDAPEGYAQEVAKARIAGSLEGMKTPAARMGVEAAVSSVPASALFQGQRIIGTGLRTGALGAAGEAGREVARGEDLDPAAIAKIGLLSAGMGAGVSKMLPEAPVPTGPSGFDKIKGFFSPKAKPTRPKWEVETTAVPEGQVFGGGKVEVGKGGKTTVKGATVMPVGETGKGFKQHSIPENPKNPRDLYNEKRVAAGFGPLQTTRYGPERPIYGPPRPSPEDLAPSVDPIFRQSDEIVDNAGNVIGVLPYSGRGAASAAAELVPPSNVDPLFTDSVDEIVDAGGNVISRVQRGPSVAPEPVPDPTDIIGRVPYGVPDASSQASQIDELQNLFGNAMKSRDSGFKAEQEALRRAKIQAKLDELEAGKVTGRTSQSATDPATGERVSIGQSFKEKAADELGEEGEDLLDTIQRMSREQRAPQGGAVPEGPTSVVPSTPGAASSEGPVNLLTGLSRPLSKAEEKQLKILYADGTLDNVGLVPGVPEEMRAVFIGWLNVGLSPKQAAAKFLARQAPKGMEFPVPKPKAATPPVDRLVEETPVEPVDPFAAFKGLLSPRGAIEGAETTPGASRLMGAPEGPYPNSGRPLMGPAAPSNVPGIAYGGSRPPVEVPPTPTAPVTPPPGGKGGAVPPTVSTAPYNPKTASSPSFIDQLMSNVEPGLPVPPKYYPSLLDELGPEYRAMQGVTKANPEYKDLARFMGRELRETGKRSESLGKATPDWAQKEMDALNLMKGQKGEIDPELLLTGALTGGGALAGAAMDNEGSPWEGAVAGAATGLGVSALGKASKNPEFRKSMWKATEMIPRIQRANYLSDVVGLPANAVVGPWSAAFVGGAEDALAGDPRGKVLMGLAKNPFNFAKDWWKSKNEAYRILKEGELGRAEGLGLEATNSGTMLDEVNRQLAIPGQAMTMGDVASRKLMQQAGYSDPESRVMTMTNEAIDPSLRQWQNAGKGGAFGPLLETLFPFKRTPINIFEQGFERLPLVGALVHAARQDADLQRVLAQQGIAIPTAIAAYLAGENLPPEVAKHVKRFVTNGSGRFALGSGLAFAAGQMNNPDDTLPPSTRLRYAAENIMPMPTADPIVEGVSWATGNGPAPRGMTPAILRQAAEWTGSEALSRLLGLEKQVRRPRIRRRRRE